MSCALVYLLFLYRSVTGAHNHGSVGASDQGVRSNGVGLGPVPLGARWGQSNKNDFFERSYDYLLFRTQ
jgi:hypothetical protein